MKQNSRRIPGDLQVFQGDKKIIFPSTYSEKIAINNKLGNILAILSRTHNIISKFNPLKPSDRNSCRVKQIYYSINFRKSKNFGI